MYRPILNEVSPFMDFSDCTGSYCTSQNLETVPSNSGFYCNGSPRNTDPCACIQQVVSSLPNSDCFGHLDWWPLQKTRQGECGPAISAGSLNSIKYYWPAELPFNTGTYYGVSSSIWGAVSEGGARGFLLCSIATDLCCSKGLDLIFTGRGNQKV